MRYPLYIIVTAITINALECATHSKHPIFVLMAFDGFRYDYLQRQLTPVLQAMATNGSSSQFMMNQFPTITFTNFHSISTGMYPETHGVVGNEVFDEQHRECSQFGQETIFHQNEDIVPIWRLNENTGDERYSGVMMWPGSSSAYQQKLPTFFRSYNETVGWTQRIDQVISWLTNVSTPANLALLYIEDPDETGHRYGPDSKQVDQILNKINLIMAYYFQRLSEQGLRDIVNTIVLSDHGMATVNQTSILNFDDYVDPKSYFLCDNSPGFQIQPKPGFKDEIYKNLTKGSLETGKFVVYKREDIPDRWHLKNNKRCADIFVECKMPYVFKDAAKKKGNHGYDNKEPAMHPIFVAQGPLFRRNFTIQPFQNIDIYPFISFVLNLLPPPPHVTPNGTLARIQQILINNENQFTSLPTSKN